MSFDQPTDKLTRRAVSVRHTVRITHELLCIFSRVQTTHELKTFFEEDDAVEFRPPCRTAEATDAFIATRDGKVAANSA